MGSCTEVSFFHIYPVKHQTTTSSKLHVYNFFSSPVWKVFRSRWKSSPFVSQWMNEWIIDTSRFIGTEKITNVFVIILSKQKRKKAATVDIHQRNKNSYFFFIFISVCASVCYLFLPVQWWNEKKNRQIPEILRVSLCLFSFESRANQSKKIDAAEPYRQN